MKEKYIARLFKPKPKYVDDLRQWRRGVGLSMIYGKQPWGDQHDWFTARNLYDGHQFAIRLDGRFHEYYEWVTDEAEQ